MNITVRTGKLIKIKFDFTQTSITLQPEINKNRFFTKILHESSNRRSNRFSRQRNGKSS